MADTAGARGTFPAQLRNPYDQHQRYPKLLLRPLLLLLPLPLVPPLLLLLLQLPLPPPLVSPHPSGPTASCWRRLNPSAARLPARLLQSPLSAHAGKLLALGSSRQPVRFPQH